MDVRGCYFSLTIVDAIGLIFFLNVLSNRIKLNRFNVIFIVDFYDNVEVHDYLKVHAYLSLTKQYELNVQNLWADITWKT